MGTSSFADSEELWISSCMGDAQRPLIVAMGHLVRQYDNKTRFLMSMHDELRYLVTEEDGY